MKKLLSQILVTSILIFILVAASVSGQSQGTKLRLVPGFTVSNQLNLAEGETSKRFRLVVSQDMFAVNFFISGSPADLDLFLYDEWGDLISFSEDVDFNEALQLSRLSAPAIFTGNYEIEVMYQLGRPPFIDGAEAQSIPFALRMEVQRVPEPVTLQTDESYTRRIPVDGAGVDLLRFNLPRNSTELRIDIFDSRTDLDFALNAGESISDPYEALLLSSSLLANEHGVFDVSRISEREFFLMVIPASPEPRDIDYQIRVSSDPSAPDQLLQIPEIPLPSGGLERSLLATVEISTSTGGGSGSIISPEGHLLTNHHVLLGEDGQISDWIAIGLTLNDRQPSAESFLARVLRYDEERDIALLKITSGLYGQDLPVGLEFPYFEIGDTDDLSLGDEMTFLGYPNIGGLGSKPTITLTRGVVSGFEDIGLGLTIKTDGEINFGNSGGAAIDASYNLVGLPTRINPDSVGKIAFIHSVDMVPDEWYEEAGIRR